MMEKIREKITGSLGRRMTISFGLVVLIVCLVLTFVSINLAGNALEDEAHQAMLKLIKQGAVTQDSWLKTRTYAVETIANRNIIRGWSGDREATLDEKIGILSNEQQRAETLGFKLLGLADKNGEVVFSNGSRANIAGQDYFQTALEGKTFVSSTTISTVDDSLVFVITSPVHHYATNEIIGVLTGVMDAAQLSELVKPITYGRTGYAFVIDKTGKTIAHKEFSRALEQENIVKKAESDKSLASLASIISRMLKGEEGVSTYAFDGQEKILAYAPIKDTGWSVAVTASTAEVLERLISLKRAMVILSIIIILLALALTVVIARSITKPIVALTETIQKLAEYDFSYDEESEATQYLTKTDEIGQAINALLNMQKNIISLIKELKTSTHTLTGDSESLSAASQEIAASSEEVAKAIEQVAVGASEQANYTQEILEFTGKIAENLESVRNELSKVKVGNEETSKLASLGKKELDVLVNSINSVQDAFRVVADKLNALSGSVNQVGKILEVINGIADQTNLLALNAAIEAARAGEAGHGFAVVANEVRKLAEESRASSDQIKVLLDSIASETDEAVNTSKNVSDQVVKQLENVDNTVKSFDDILDSVIAITPKIEETYRHLDSTMQAEDAALERVESISAVSEEVSASAEQISASAEELSASTEEIAANAQEVLGVAKNLDEQIGKFKV